MAICGIENAFVLGCIIYLHV